MRDPSRRVAALAAVTAVVVAVLAVVTNVATAQVPHTLRFLTPPSRAWMLTGFLIVVSAVLAFMAARSGDRPRQVSTPEQIEAAADLLAQRTMAFWADQVVTRGIQTPAPVRVRWKWAPGDIALPRQELNTSPSLGTDPHPLPPGPSGGAGEVLGSGLVARLHDEVYAQLQHGRLVLIGGPGAGKTGAMILLLLEALRHRRGQVPAAGRPGVPVPVWLTLGSWNPNEQGLREWVTATMVRDHPYLQAVDFGPDAISQLIDTGRVALFLDGLDEMPDALRDRALERLAVEAGGLRVVLTSRPGEYKAALDLGGQLPYAAVVELRPVRPQAAADYLLEGQVGPARAKWQQVVEHLQADRGGVLAGTLNTPLTLSLARSAYTHADPAGLLAPELDTKQALRGHLLDQVLVTAYSDPSERADAAYWLGWIAHRMGASRDLGWWQVSTWIPRSGFRLVIGLVTGFAAGLTGLLAGSGAGPGVGFRSGIASGLPFLLIVYLGGIMEGYNIYMSGLPIGEVQSALRRSIKGGLLAGVYVAWVCGVVSGVGSGLGSAAGIGIVAAVTAVVASEPTLPNAAMRPRTLVFRRLDRGDLGTLFVDAIVWLIVVAIIGIIAGATGGVARGHGIGFEIMVGACGGAVVGLIFGLGFGLEKLWAKPLHNSGAATPGTIYRASLRGAVVHATTLLLGFGSVVGFVTGLVTWFLAGPQLGFMTGFVTGIAAWLVFATRLGAAADLQIAEIVLALQGKGRVRLIDLLNDSTARQLLRQAGAVYQFRHAELQDRLADRFEREHVRGA